MPFSAAGDQNDRNEKARLTHKRVRKTAARIGNHKDVVAEESAIRRRKRVFVRPSSKKRRTDRKTEKAEKLVSSTAAWGSSVSVIPERQSECTRLIAPNGDIFLNKVRDSVQTGVYILMTMDST